MGMGMGMGMGMEYLDEQAPVVAEEELVVPVRALRHVPFGLQARERALHRAECTV